MGSDPSVLQNQILGVDDRNNWNELQSNFCSVVIVSVSNSALSLSNRATSQSVIRKLNDGIQPLADRIMTLILQLIQAAGKTSTVLEDAFLVVGSLAAGT
jgi:importin subunit beta-1